MDLGFHIHHILTRAALTTYEDDINQLFGGNENNPFALNANSNKVALVND